MKKLSKQHLLTVKIDGILQSQKNVKLFGVTPIYNEIADFLSAWYDDSTTLEVKTSGTTGAAKLIHLPKMAMLASAHKTCRFFNINKQSTLLLALSPKFIAGKMMLIRAMVSGADILVASSLSKPFDQLPCPIDFTSLVPMQLLPYLEKPEKFENVQTILLGGAPIDKRIESKLQNLHSNFFHSYGMTETSSHVALRSLNGTNKSASYTALPNTTFSINDQQQLIIHSPDILKKSIVTNDIVDLVNSKSFRWLGRKDNVVNSGGIKLFPETIEDKLRSEIESPFYLTSEADEVLGQRLIMILEESSELSDLKLEQVFRRILEPYEKPKKIIRIKQINKTETGKVIRQ